MENLPMKANQKAPQGLKPNKWTYIAIVNPVEADNLLSKMGFPKPENDLQRAQLLYRYYHEAPDKEVARQEITALHPDKAFMLHNTMIKSSFDAQEKLNCGGCDMKKACDATKMSAAGKPAVAGNIQAQTTALIIGGSIFVALLVGYALFKPKSA